ncbi:hypothetical protein XENOCAPTIV_030887 [Xenoophorus captivus]|uniref:Uncharacterized protein n=1 Tax=Xenoophorus captivus TaxID=1517983 RepID=A0ABV0QUI3_9TELE
MVNEMLHQKMFDQVQTTNLKLIRIVCLGLTVIDSYSSHCCKVLLWCCIIMILSNFNFNLMKTVMLELCLHPVAHPSTQVQMQLHLKRLIAGHSAALSTTLF